MVKKLCLINGKWYKIKRKSSFNEWTDYSGCVSNNVIYFIRCLIIN